MTTILWLVVLLPFAGALVLFLFGAAMGKRAAGVVACAAVGLSWLAAMTAAGRFLAAPAPEGVSARLYPWMAVDGLRVSMDLRLDGLSLVYMLIVTFVAFLIHLYASQSMYDEDGYSRFFAYMNLFVGSMLLLVLAENLVLLYFGWEGVGLCSYLLIGFWYRVPANGYAAQKAFIVTRVGDTALAIGLFLLFRELGTLDIPTLLARAPVVLAAGGGLVTLIAYLIIGGAIGKSAQVPLQVWLPDAMAGPTPVSALIHAATMVTAGVYLIARLHVLFLMAPSALLAVAVIGTITLFYSGFTALVQTDIKKVLAYSTISQIGYMFLGLGVGAWAAAIFHFVTHAFFKALLFLAAGAASDALHHELNIFRMGGLARRLPLVTITFAIGAASLSAVPLVTAGFYSKDAILVGAQNSAFGSPWFVILGLAAALMTAAYSFRAFFIAFLGDAHQEIEHGPGFLVQGVLVVLAFFAIVAGFFEDRLEHVLAPVFEAALQGSAELAGGSALPVIGGAIALLGILLAWLYYRNRVAWSQPVAQSSAGRALHAFFFSGWGFDWLYQMGLVRPFKALILANREDVVDVFYTGLAEAARLGNEALSLSQSGRVRGYAAGVVLGAVVVAAIALLR